MSKWIRQTHRWVSIAFTVTVIANFVALARTGGELPPPWITYSPLLPLALLMFSGLYLFALPYATKWRSGQPEGGSIDSTIAAVSGASDAVARTEASRAAIEQELERLARENKTLYRAALKYIEAEDAYIGARAEAASSQGSQ